MLWTHYRRFLAQPRKEGGHGIPWDAPESARLARLTAEEAEKCLDNLVFFAEWRIANRCAGLAVHEETVDRALAVYFARPGNVGPQSPKGYLNRVKHPLRGFADECGDIVLQCIAAEKRENAAPAQPDTAPMARPASFAQGARAVFEAVGAAAAKRRRVA